MKNTLGKDKFRDTDKELRELLEDIYATSNLYVVDDITSRVTKAIRIDLQFLIYIREKRWFELPSHNSSDNHLKFNFISFEYLGAETKRFDTLDELKSRERDLLANGFEKIEKPLCTIIFQNNTELDIERILNLLGRILVAFYRNCGSFDHFRESVSTRYIKEFYAKYFEPSVLDLFSYISEKSDLSCSLWRQRDEMYFRNDELSVQDLLTPYPNSNSKLPVFLEDVEFRRSLKTSVLRKNQTQGKTEDKKHGFVVKTFLDFTTSEHSSDAGSARTQALAVAIYSKLEEMPISLNGVYHANNLIEHFIRRECEYLNLNFANHADEACLKNELRISQNPIKTRVELRSIIATTIESIFETVAEITHADEIRLWIKKEAYHSFEPIVFIKGKIRSHDESEIEILVDKHIVNHVMEKQKTISLSHDDWIASEVKITKRRPGDFDRDGKLKELNRAKALRENLDDSAEVRGAALAIPVHRGISPLGVLEVTASEVGHLEAERAVFIRLAKICGDTVRRLEFANDRGWLVRMSSLHTARHRLETLLRELENNDAEEAAKSISKFLQSTQQNSQKNPILPEIESVKRTEKRISDCLAECAEERQIEEFLNNFRTIQDSVGLSPMSCYFVAEIMETLTDNRSHSNFRLDCVNLSYREKSSGLVEIQLTYSPPEVMLAIDRLEQITVSPILDTKSPTFHYGLFLLAAQVRMLGGAATIQLPIEDDGLGFSRFGLIFSLPAKGG